MEYKVFDNVIAARLDIGDEIIESLKTICSRENVRAAYVTAIGAVNHAVTGVLDSDKGEYVDTEYNEFMELLSLLGNISVMNDEVYVHLHATLSGHDSNAVGGHLRRATIGATCEMFIHKLDGTIGRKQCEKTGINIFDF